MSQNNKSEILNRNRGVERGKAPATSYQLSAHGLRKSGGQGGGKERASLANAYDGFHINSGATYCIVIRGHGVDSPAWPPDAGSGKELKDAN